MKYKIFVDLQETEEKPEREVCLILDEERKEHLENEIAGGNIGVWEYETADKEIICDLDILRINKIEVLENGK